jgi:hypothetical protein
MARDARLACIEILAMAARRARERQTTAPRQTVTLQVEYYDARGIEPPSKGESYVYTLPAKAPGGPPWHLMPD